LLDNLLSNAWEFLLCYFFILAPGNTSLDKALNLSQHLDLHGFDGLFALRVVNVNIDAHLLASREGILLQGDLDLRLR
jgi:hypothetical protein